LTDQYKERKKEDGDRADEYCINAWNENNFITMESCRPNHTTYCVLCQRLWKLKSI